MTEENSASESLETNAKEDQPSAYGVPTTAQLNRINQFSKRPLSKEEVFVFRAKMVGDGMIENRFMKLDKSLLAVYKKDAKDDGVAFMLDHAWVSWGGPLALPYGRTFDATLSESLHEPDAPEDETVALYGDIYIVRGKELDGIGTDELIKMIEDGTLSDVSIGFGAKTYECSVCGKSIFECDHWPGKTYDVDGKKVLCYIILKPPGFLMELSGVFDGAYASAKILAKTGDSESEYYEVENIKEVPQGTQMFHILSKRGFFTFAKKEKVVSPQIDPDRAREIAGANWQENIFKLAQDGKVLRERLIKDALAWGVRALGESFDEEFYRKEFSDMSIERIEGYVNQWTAMAKAAIPTGRKVQSKSEASKALLPSEAFKV